MHNKIQKLNECPYHFISKQSLTFINLIFKAQQFRSLQMMKGKFILFILGFFLQLEAMMWHVSLVMERANREFLWWKTLMGLESHE